MIHDDAPPAVRRVLDRLGAVRRSGSGWSARCPAHEDTNPSLSVSAGDDGRALIKCHAGCRPESIVAAVGLTAGDLFADLDPPGPNRPPIVTGKPGPGSRVYPTAAEAVADLERRHGPRAAVWTYHDAAGVTVGLVVRWDRPGGGKDIRPVALTHGGWRVGAMPGPRPLYRLPELAGAGVVAVCEGEPAADAARSLGFVATTSSGGAQAATKTDWAPLAGKEVWVFPDNDPPGRRYASAVAVILLPLGCTVRVVELPGLPEGGDLVDWVAAHGDTVEPVAMRAAVETLAAAVEPELAERTTPAPAAGPRYVPDVVRLSDVEPVAVPWLWPGRVPLGRISLLVGRPGAGKSFLTCDLTARISTGGRWPDGGTAPAGDVLLISAEDDPADTTVPRLAAAGADRRRVHWFRAVKLVEASGQERTVAFDLSNIDLIRDTLNRLPGCKLVVVDPIGSYLGGRVDAHRDNEVRAVLAPLAALAARAGVAVLLVAHTRKAAASFADDTALGSRAFTGLARSVLHLTADDGDRDRKLLLPGKCNLSVPAPGLAFRIAGTPPRLSWEPDPLDGAHADDYLSERAGVARGPEPRARDAAADWLAGLLRSGPVAAAEVWAQAAEAGLSRATVRRAQGALGIVPRKREFAGPWVWELPAESA
ncbi:MAG: AAA family ATPase [Gemmataceae bacterium]